MDGANVDGSGNTLQEAVADSGSASEEAGAAAEGAAEQRQDDASGTEATEASSSGISEPERLEAGGDRLSKLFSGVARSATDAAEADVETLDPHELRTFVGKHVLPGCLDLLNRSPSNVHVVSRLLLDAIPFLSEEDSSKGFQLWQSLLIEVVASVEITTNAPKFSHFCKK